LVVALIESEQKSSPAPGIAQQLENSGWQRALRRSPGADLIFVVYQQLEASEVARENVIYYFSEATRQQGVVEQQPDPESRSRGL
jgi:hypothetical protein